MCLVLKKDQTKYANQKSSSNTSLQKYEHSNLCHFWWSALLKMGLWARKRFSLWNGKKLQSFKKTKWFRLLWDRFLERNRFFKRKAQNRFFERLHLNYDRERLISPSLTPCSVISNKETNLAKTQVQTSWGTKLT